MPTLVALLTPAGRGAVASVLVEGPAAVSTVSTLFHPAAPDRSFDSFPVGRIVFGRWSDTQGEELVGCRLASDRVELHCHGGHVAAQRIIDDLQRLGCGALSWTEWLHHSSSDLLRAEAQAALAQAHTERTAAILLDQWQGALGREVASMAARLTAPNAAVAIEALQRLVARLPLGLHLTQPWKVVLAGRPNVGKSSLINALLGYRRAIVFDQPGTTRDVLTATTALNGWPIEFSDTAGLRASDDPLESAGIRRAQEQIAAADCLVLVFEAHRPWTHDDEALAREWPAALIVHNKADLATIGNETRPPGLRTSATTQQGIEALVQTLAAHLVPDAPPPGAPVPFTPRQAEQLQRALDAGKAGDLAAAQAALRELL